MAKKRIQFALTDKGIHRAIAELKQHRKEFEDNCERLRRIVAERLREEAQHGFSGAIVDDLTAQSGGPRLADVRVTTEDSGKVTLVIARGEDAVWVEFGAGVFHNGAAGSSPNPYGASLGFVIGGYGDKGKRRAWGFYDDGELKISRGTPAAMPMFRAVQGVIEDMDAIVREVFS